jgi:hypothetical protein
MNGTGIANQIRPSRQYARRVLIKTLHECRRHVVSRVICSPELRCYVTGSRLDPPSRLHRRSEAGIADAQLHDGFHARILGLQRLACRFQRRRLSLKTLGLSPERPIPLRIKNGYELVSGQPYP